MTGLTDYERGYRAAQERAVQLMDRSFAEEGAAEAWAAGVQKLKIERAMPVPPDPGPHVAPDQADGDQ